MKIKTETQTGSIVSFKYDDEIAEITGLTTSFEPIQDGTPWQSDIEQTPYLNRRSPDLDHDYNSEMDTLIGGTIAWNQLVMNDESTSTNEGITYTKNSNGSWRVTGTYSARSYKYLSTLNIGGINADDVVYVSSTYKMPANTGLIFDFRSESAYIGGTQVYPNGSYTITKVPSGATVLGRPYININNLSVGTAIDFTVKPIFVNLTRLLGSTIANYVYSLEQSTAGSGIAWLKSYGFLTKDYYAYNDGSLVSVKTSEHKTTGKNLIPMSINNIKSINTEGTWSGNAYTRNGITFTLQIDGDGNITGIKANGTANGGDGTLRLHTGSLNIRGTFILSGGISTDAWIFIANVGQSNVTDFTFTTTGINATIGLALRNGKTANNLTFYPMIRWASVSDATYEPYTVHSYPLDSDLELRGIPKLSNGSLYYDGDEYRADGSVTRKYGIVDLGTLDYTYYSGSRIFESGVISDAKQPSSRSAVANMVCAKFVSASRDGVWNGLDKSVALNPSDFSERGKLWIRDVAYTDAATFKTAMSGVYLVYELATPTTEQSTSFTSPQIVSPNGTEEYVDTRSVPVPVGHRTTYMMPYPISGWDEVKAYVSPTEEEEDATIYTINLNGTRYGGTIDFFRGVMNVAYAYANMGSLTWSKENASGSHWRFRANISDIKQNTSASNVMPVWCSAYEAKSPNQTWNGETGISVSNGVRAVQVASENFSDATSFKNAMSGVQLVYELAEPIEVQLTAQQIEALQGQNYVWCDSGDTTLTWRHIPVLDEAVMLNGKYLELTIDGYSTLGTSGRRSLGRQLDTFSVGTADGETVKNSTFPSRKITVNYVIQTDTEEELTDAINQLANILNQKECDFIFRDEPDKYFSGYGLLDSEPKKYRHAVKGTWTIYCAYPFKRSVETTELVSTESAIVEDYSATFEFNYNGTLPARPILRAEFASSKSGGDYSEDGDCGFVAFVDPSKNIIQLGNPDIVDLDQYEQYANETLVNSVFDDLTGWTASGITVGSIADQFWNNGAGQTQNYAKGTGALYRSVTGSVNFDFSMVHRLCVNGEGETGKFEALAKNGNDIVAGFRIEKTGNGTSGTVYYILNNKEVGKDVIDLSYYNTNFGYCKRDPVYVDKFRRYDPFDPFHDPYWYVSPIHRHDPFYSKRTRQVQKGWSYTQSNLNSRINKNGKVVTFTIGTLAQRTFKSSDIEFSPATIVTFNLDGGFNTNAVRSAKFTKGAGTSFSNVPNVFTAGDIVEADCNSADVTIYRAGSIEGRLEPKYGALGNDWEQFVIRPGTNIIRAVWSNWVDTDYKPEIRIIFNEVYL